MPVSISEVAEACGISKPTVRKYLKRLNLWEDHVNRDGAAFMVDEFAAAAVASEAEKQKPVVRRAALRPESDASEAPSLSDLYEARIADLNKVIENQRADLARKDEQIAALNAQMSSLSARLEESQAAEHKASDAVARMAGAGLWQRIVGFKGLLSDGR